VYFDLAVIDFLRMFVLHPDGAALLLKTIETGNGRILDSTLFANPSPSLSHLNYLHLFKHRLFICLHYVS